MAMLIEPDEIDFSKYMEETESRRKIRCASDYIEEMIASIGSDQAVLAGWDLPWEKSKNLFRFHPGEVTLWAGPNGSGKSLITGMVGLDLTCQREKVCVASFEMPPKKTLGRMARSWCGTNPAQYHGSSVGEDLLRRLYSDMKIQSDGHLFIYDQLGSVKSETALAVVRYCARERGIKHIIIDSLMKCVRGTDDYNAQKDFVNELCTIAKDEMVTIHLVCHTKKLADESKRPSKYDIAGTGDITNLVDNVLLFWRNKPKEAERRAYSTKLDHEPDAILSCCKQRELGEEPEFSLWYERDSETYIEGPNAGPINWVGRCK